MKKAPLSLLAVTLIFLFACSPKPTYNGNANPPVAGTTAASIPVVINLGTKPGSDVYCFTATPESVTISIKNADQILWIINDSTDLGLTDVKITKFKGQRTGNTDPFGNGGTFTFPEVSAHSAPDKPSGRVAGAEDTYTYEVVGTIIVEGRPVTVKLDPRVVISG